MEIGCNFTIYRVTKSKSDEKLKESRGAERERERERINSVCGLFAAAFSFFPTQKNKKKK
jgi:hypothetical protein